MVNPWPQTPRGQPATKPEQPCRISLFGRKQDTRTFHSIAFIMVFSKKVRGQKHPWDVCYYRHITSMFLQYFNHFQNLVQVDVLITAIMKHMAWKAGHHRLSLPIIGVKYRILDILCSVRYDDILLYALPMNISGPKFWDLLQNCFMVVMTPVTHRSIRYVPHQKIVMQGPLIIGLHQQKPSFCVPGPSLSCTFTRFITHSVSFCGISLEYSMRNYFWDFVVFISRCLYRQTDTMNSVSWALRRLCTGDRQIR